jgi:hypothetical protein
VDRRAAAVVAALAAVTAAGALAVAKTKSSGEKKGPPVLHVRAIDLQKRIVLVEVSGVERVPPANYFTFTDERGRKFVANDCRCDAPFPSGARACELELPAGYERRRITSVLFHRGGLHGKPIVADEAEVASAWAAAQAIAADAGTP